ncbi:hypothetical protein IJ425_07490 [bacterium]|nr:hypothetical protein [bacterium]
MNITHSNFYPEKKQNYNSQKVKGIAQIGVAGAIGYKGITSGIRRALGVRIEEHTTSGKNAKQIIKNGCILDPQFGGTGAAATKGAKSINKSKGFIHITGFHKDGKSIYEPRVLGGNPYPNKQGFVTWEQRKTQKLVYKCASVEPTTPLKAIKEISKTKTFYIGGTDDYFNKNFIPDTDDIALKTTEKLKVHKTKIGASIDALKREGLSGIKQNKNRVIVGILIATSCFLIAYNLIKKGINNLQNNK